MSLDDDFRRAVRAGLLDDAGPILCRRVEDLVEQKLDAFRERLLGDLARHGGAINNEADELWPTERAYKALGYRTPGALRKANERGTAPVKAIRMGKRALRWRAGDVRAYVVTLAAKGGR